MESPIEGQSTQYRKSGVGPCPRPGFGPESCQVVPVFSLLPFFSIEGKKRGVHLAFSSPCCPVVLPTAVPTVFFDLIDSLRQEGKKPATQPMSLRTCGHHQYPTAHTVVSVGLVPCVAGGGIRMLRRNQPQPHSWGLQGRIKSRTMPSCRPRSTAYPESTQ